MFYKIFDTYRFYAPLISFFLPLDQFFLWGGLACLLIVLDINTFSKSIKYKQNWILYLFTTYMIFLAYINDNTLGLIASFFLVLVTIYTSYLRLSLSKIRFEISTIILGLGSFLSLYYCTVDFYTTSTYKLYEFFMEYIHIPYSFITGLADGVRSSSTFINPNYYGHISAFIALIAISQLIKYVRLLPKKTIISLLMILFFTLVLGVNIVGLVLSQSRSSFIGLIVGILFLVWAYDRMGFFILICGILIYSLKNTDWIFLAFPRIEALELSADLRIRIYLITLEEIKNNLFIGKGLYTFPLIYQNYDISYFVHTHNLILEALLDSGLIGTILFLGHFIKSIVKPIRQWLHHTHAYVPLILAVIGLEIATGFTDAVIVFPQTFILISLVFYSGELTNETL